MKKKLPKHFFALFPPSSNADDEDNEGLDEEEDNVGIVEDEDDDADDDDEADDEDEDEDISLRPRIASLSS